jgi:hypothetical protein
VFDGKNIDELRNKGSPGDEIVIGSKPPWEFNKEAVADFVSPGGISPSSRRGAGSQSVQNGVTIQAYGCAIASAVRP